MGLAGDSGWYGAVQEVLSGSHLWRPEDLADRLAAAVAGLGLRTTVYLTDYEQRTLRPVPQPGRDLPDPAPIGTSMAGRSYTQVRPLLAVAGGESRWWVPMVDGTDRLGVIEFVCAEGVDARDPLLSQRCQQLTGLIGHLLVSVTARGDHLEAVRRSRPMSAAGELLWQMLPPRTAAFEHLVISAVLEPCYAVGGDGFDYAVDGSRAWLTVLDAVGHGLSAGLACMVALATLRAGRRAGQDLEGQARAADAALAEQFPDSRFVTAVLADLDLDTGRMRYFNAGHPAPLLLRRARVVGELEQGRRLPLGLGHRAAAAGEITLEPGDQLLLYTDGVTEALTPGGDRFGVARLAALAERHAADGLPAPEALRRLAHAVGEHQEGDLADDATLVLMAWSGRAAQRAVPRPDPSNTEEPAP